MYKNILCFLIFTFATSSAFCGVSAVGREGCAQLKNKSNAFILVLKPGESLFTALIQCCSAAHIASASVTGLGGVKDPALTFFTRVDGDPHKKILKGDYALTALVGNVTTNAAGKLQAHLHALLNQMDFRVYGGHLEEAQVSDNVEITIIPQPFAIKRKMNEDAGFETIPVKS